MSNVSVKIEIEYLLKELKLTKNLNTGKIVGNILTHSDFLSNFYLFSQQMA